MYNKSEIMKNAWRIYKGSNGSFSACLSLAWKKAKEALTKTTAATVKVGDKLVIEYGDYNNNMTVTVTSIEQKTRSYDFVTYTTFYVVNAISEKGLAVDFCLKLDEEVKYAIAG